MDSADPILASGPQSRAGVPEYGRRGFYGVLTPQANPTVEPELRILLPRASALVAARMSSRAAGLRERLADYFEHLEQTVDEFDGLSLDAVGFACTGSSYGRAPGEEHRLVDRVAERVGCPFVTAAGATGTALAHLGVDSIALISPYPAWLSQACAAHWRDRGLRITALLELAPTPGSAHPIYARTSGELTRAAAGFDVCGADAVLIAGTGMPSLRAIPVLERELGVPVISSNLCLAWALARTTGTTAPGSESRLYGGWLAQLDAA